MFSFFWKKPNKILKKLENCGKINIDLGFYVYDIEMF